MYLIGNYTKRREKSDRLYYIDLHVLQFSTKTTSVIYNFTMLSQAYIPFSRYFNSEALESYFVLSGH